MTTAMQQAMATGLLISVLQGCATAPSVAPVPRGESLAITIARSPDAGGEISIRNQALGDNMAVGVSSGTLIGALYGLSCGPFAVLCVPLGAMAGTVTGLAAGAAVGMTGALAEDDAAKVRARTLRVQQSHGMVEELGREVNERAGLQWNLKSATPNYVLNLELQDIRLTSTRDARIGFVVSVLVRSGPIGALPKAGTHEKRFEYLGPFVSLTAWTDDSSDVLDGNLSIASKQLALQIISELTPH